MKVFPLVSLLISILVAVNCDERYEKIAGRIVGGVEITIEKTPYQVALLYYGFYLCGGSILSCKYVLTAAHCTEYTTASSLSVRAGSTQHNSGGSIHNVIKITEHPNFNSNSLDYDAAILTLSNLIRYDEYRQSIRLPNVNEVTAQGTPVSTSGWGNTQNSSISNINLRYVELKVTNQAKCNEAHIADGGVTSRMICASALGKDSCSGDSGGPLKDLNKNKLVGIVSFGPPGGCANDAIPGVYTRVAVIRSWIRQTIGF